VLKAGFTSEWLSYCRFANKVFKVVHGFPTRLACGRTCTEIYLHMLERDLWTLFRHQMKFARRYIDNFQCVFDSEKQAHAFIAAYGKLDDSVQITADVSPVFRLVMRMHSPCINAFKICSG